MKIPKTFLPDKNLEKKTEELLAENKRVLKYSKFNTFKIDNERLQYFSDLCCEQAYTLNDNQKRLLIKAYCIHVLGVSKEILEDFVEGVYNKIGQPHNPGPKRTAELEFAEQAIGMRQGGAIEIKGDFESFWDAMKTLFPFDYTQEDIEHLIKYKEFPAFHMIDQLENFNPNHLLKALKANARRYR